LQYFTYFYKSVQAYDLDAGLNAGHIWLCCAYFLGKLFLSEAALKAGCLQRGSQLSPVAHIDGLLKILLMAFLRFAQDGLLSS
jgi:hypothetical protein